MMLFHARARPGATYISSRTADPRASTRRQFRGSAGARLSAILLAVRGAPEAASRRAPGAALLRAAARMDRAKPSGVFRADARTCGARAGGAHGRRPLRAHPYLHSARGPAGTDAPHDALSRKTFWPAARRSVAGRARLGAAASFGAGARGNRLHACG